jgi:hypothetical protein
MTVSLATLEAELGGSQSEVSQAKTGDPTWKITRAKSVGGIAQAADSLPCKHKALS